MLTRILRVAIALLLAVVLTLIALIALDHALGSGKPALPDTHREH